MFTAALLGALLVTDTDLAIPLATATALIAASALAAARPDRDCIPHSTTPRRAGGKRGAAAGRGQVVCRTSRRVAMAWAIAARVACVSLSGLSIMKSCVMPS
jgi:hypothetical protein